MYTQKHPIDSVLVFWLWRQLKIGYLMLIPDMCMKETKLLWVTIRLDHNIIQKIPFPHFLCWIFNYLI